MYKHDARQISITDLQPEMFGNVRLDPNNRWVLLSRAIPWVDVEEEYRKHFRSRRGQDPFSARLALGVSLIKTKLNLSDRETVEALRENPYLQYFVGYSEYNYDLKLDVSMLTRFRKRLPADVIAYVDERVAEHERKIRAGNKDEAGR